MAPRPSPTAGQKLVRSIERDLADGLELDNRDRATLDLIRATRDDIERLEIACAEVLIEDVAGTKKLNQAFTEVRLARAQLHRLILSMKLTADELPAVKSDRHQHAANARWRRGSA